MSPLWLADAYRGRLPETPHRVLPVYLPTAAASTYSGSSIITKTLPGPPRIALQPRRPYVLAPVSRVTTCHYMFHMLSIAGGRLVFSAQDARALTPAGTRRLVPFPYSPPSKHLEPSEAFVNKLRRGFLLRAVLPRQLFQKRLNIMVRMQGPSPLAYCMAVFDEARGRFVRCWR